jgi:RNA polymerase sigma-70 factor (ECF subfamily)
MGCAYTELAALRARAPEAATHTYGRPSERAINDVFRTRRGVLTRFAWRLTRNRFDAEDLVQHAFLKAYERDPQLSAEQLLPWLTTVIRRLAIDRIRQNAVHSRYAEVQWSLGVHVDAESATTEQVNGWTRKLPDALRQTFALWWAGASYQAIALAQDVPVGTVATRVSRAKVHLRSLRKADCGE